MSDKGDVTKVETVAQPGKKPLRRKLIDHFKKWWWAHLIIFCISFLIITLCLVYVGFPNIAQGDVSDAVLTVQSQTVTDPTPDSVTLHIESINDSKSVFHPELDAFNASLSLSTSDSSDDALPPFGQIEIPSGIAGSDVGVTVDQVMPITDMDQFIKYNVAVLTSESFYLYVSGDVTLHEGKFPATTCNYDKIVTMKGLNSLDGFKITNVKMDITAQGKKNLHGDIFIPNPSVLTIEMGDVYMDMFVDGINIGYSVLPNLTLKPGDNNIKMWGHSSLTGSLKALPKYVNDLQHVPIDIKGNRSEINGQSIPYYTAAIQSNPMHAIVDLSQSVNTPGGLKALLGGGGGGGGL